MNKHVLYGILGTVVILAIVNRVAVLAPVSGAIRVVTG